MYNQVVKRKIAITIAMAIMIILVHFSYSAADSHRLVLLTEQTSVVNFSTSVPIQVQYLDGSDRPIPDALIILSPQSDTADTTLRNLRVLTDSNGIAETFIVAGATQVDFDVLIGVPEDDIVTPITVHVRVILPDVGPDNQAPVANAGADQAVHVGTLATLDGSSSSDPDGDYPLTYSWQITSKPGGSIATLSDSTAVNPSFTADSFGDYTAELVVTDSQSLSGTPDTVLVSTSNTPPVADAGRDQAIILLGSTIQLDGTQSYDDDGDTIYYSWTMGSKPVGSTATLSDFSSVSTRFVADVQGDYVVNLVVDDTWAASDPDSVAVGFTNRTPVADAGGNQAVIVGDSVFLNAAGCTDANGDPLTYSWSLASKPDGSAASLTGATTSMASFTADAPGTYVASLVVNDGFVDSDPGNASVTAITADDAAAMALMEAVHTINHDLNPNIFKNRNMVNALTNKINAVLVMIDQGEYLETIDKLSDDVLGKTDGCSTDGSPDKNDWIRGCSEQSQVQGLINEAIGLLSGLL